MRLVTTRSGKSGLRLRDWITANNASSSAPPVRNAIVVWLAQLVVSAGEKPNTSENNPAETVSTPGMSSLGLTAGAWLCSSASAPVTAIVANTRLTYML